MSQIREAVALIQRCHQLRGTANEHTLRTQFAARLHRVFPHPNDERWINHYVEGTEATAWIATPQGLRIRFIDTLVRSTVIEYEPDLRDQRKRENGFRQVKTYAAAVIREGANPAQIRGVLSDTVEWYVYDVTVREGVRSSTLTADDICLTLVDELQATDDERGAEQFIRFLRRHLAREQSRPLDATHIAHDLGPDSFAYQRHVEIIRCLATTARDQDTSVALATDLWSRFVDHLFREGQPFRLDAYAGEAYLAILARLMAANVLEMRALLSDPAELRDILTGRFFQDRFGLINMVERDYFGWMTCDPHLQQMVAIAAEIQLDLYAYDFSSVAPHDLFGRMMAQLAGQTQRQLLGQEWTPSWLARIIVGRGFDLVPSDDVRMVDIACGSGAFIVEALQELRQRQPDCQLQDLQNIITGFDIDPLAVLLARTTWVAAVADRIRERGEPITIPIYHADSLFTVTPLSRSLPELADGAPIPVDLDGQTIHLPQILFSPELRPIFDDLVDWAHDEALAARRNNSAAAITRERVEGLVATLLERLGNPLSADERAHLTTAAISLVRRMAELAIANRNGIWAFVLKNTYRPSLLAGQFNALVTNPPWLAMSRIADNPYGGRLIERARQLGIRSSGAAHPHVELATSYLLHAVERYLQSDAAVLCILPGTVTKGQHHKPFRDARYLTSQRPVPLEVSEVWDVANHPFKLPAIVLVGHKRAAPEDVVEGPRGGYRISKSGLEHVPTFHVARLGANRTSWSMNEHETVSGLQEDEALAQEGADILPRKGTCIEVVSETEPEYRVRTPAPNGPFGFAISQPKKLIDQNFNGWVAPRYLHWMLYSGNLLPFCLDERPIRIAIPAHRDDRGYWRIQNPDQIRADGFLRSARWFRDVNAAMQQDNIVRPLEQKINERGKLLRQVFPQGAFLVFNGAGGGISCAAWLPVDGNESIVVEQTLYWRVVTSEDEARFRVAILNSSAISRAVVAFNPEGLQGPRHLHTLPNRVVPAFDPTDDRHQRLVELASTLQESARAFALSDRFISDPSRALARRRSRLRTYLATLDDYVELEALAMEVLSAN